MGVTAFKKQRKQVMQLRSVLHTGDFEAQRRRRLRSSLRRDDWKLVGDEVKDS